MNLMELFVLSCVIATLLFIVGNTFLGLWGAYTGLLDIVLECLKWILLLYFGLVLSWSLQYIIPFIIKIV